MKPLSLLFILMGVPARCRCDAPYNIMTFVSAIEVMNSVCDAEPVPD